MPVNRHKRRLRALIDRVCADGRLVSRDVATIALVPRFQAEVERQCWQGLEQLAFRLRTPGQTKWTPWLTSDAAARRLRDAGFVDHAIARMDGLYLEEVRRA